MSKSGSKVAKYLKCTAEDQGMFCQLLLKLGVFMAF